MDYGLIIEIVKKAGELAFEDRMKNRVEVKGEADFVTEVDTAISGYIKKELAAVTPDIGFMSEEETGRIAPVRWILDPIDGTTNLIYNYNLSSVSLALCSENRIDFGVVYNPFNKEIFVAQRGKGATHNGIALPACKDREPSDSLIEFGAGSTRKYQSDVAFSIGKEVFENFLDIRRMCSSALAICYVACGRLGGYFEKVLKPWDVAAADLILEECGGKSSTWERTAVPFDKPFSYVCGTPKCFNKLLDIIDTHDNTADGNGI